MKRPPVVYVLWLDAHGLGASEDVSPDEVSSRLHRGWPTHTVGFLLRSDDKGVSIATDVQEPNDDDEVPKPNYRGTHFIPRVMIQREQVLGRKPRAPKQAANQGVK
jgi:hypothetical protein